MVEHWFVAPGIWVRFPVATPPGTLGSMDRASGFGPEGWGFESLRVHQIKRTGFSRFFVLLQLLFQV